MAGTVQEVIFPAVIIQCTTLSLSKLETYAIPFTGDGGGDGEVPGGEGPGGKGPGGEGPGGEGPEGEGLGCVRAGVAMVDVGNPESERPEAELVDWTSCLFHYYCVNIFFLTKVKKRSTSLIAQLCSRWLSGVILRIKVRNTHLRNAKRNGQHRHRHRRN